ncbi:MAG: PEGA domain-containing protein [Planctomycetota bacterium]|nr:PEGA domain-containing protein [Planctomycetota bacterium]
MPRTLLAVSVLAALALAGCYGQVQRTITIDSEPEGARCWLNDNEVGRTPVTVPFTWYGTYSVRLEHPGYEPLLAEAAVRAPPFQWIGPDLAYETVVPGIHHDTHAFRYALHEAKPTDPDGLRQRAESLRRDAGMPAFAPIMRPAPAVEEPPEPAPAEEKPPEPPSPEAP